MLSLGRLVERRRDPRTSKPYSLHNLLKMRAEKEGLLLAVLGTPQGYVMASSRDQKDRQGARIAAHASAELFGTEARSFFTKTGPSWPDVRFLAFRFEAEGKPLFLAVLVPERRAFSPEGLAACVKRILSEPAVAVAA